MHPAGAAGRLERLGGRGWGPARRVWLAHVLKVVGRWRTSVGLGRPGRAGARAHATDWEGVAAGVLRVGLMLAALCWLLHTADVVPC